MNRVHIRFIRFNFVCEHTHMRCVVMYVRRINPIGSINFRRSDKCNAIVTIHHYVGFQAHQQQDHIIHLAEAHNERIVNIRCRTQRKPMQYGY